MRLKNMYLLCKNNIEYFKNSPYERVINGSGTTIYYQIQNFDLFVDSVNELNKVKCLDSSLKEMCNTLGDSILRKEKHKIFPDQFNTFQTFLNALIARMQTIIDLGDSLGFENVENGFDIKLPPNLSLLELGQCITDINKSFSQCPLFNNNEEKIEFKGADIGSLWLEFTTIATGSGIIINNLAKIVDKCVAIKSHILTVNMQKEQLKSMKMDNELKENMVSGFKQMTDELIQNVSTELQDETGKLDNEDNQRLNMCLKLLSEWMAKGLEIHSALNAPEEVKALFPLNDKMDFLPKEVKMIENQDE